MRVVPSILFPSLVAAWAPAARAELAFSDQLSVYGWQTWGFILLYGGLGALLRIAVSRRAPPCTPLDVAGRLFVGIVSGLLGFACVEAFCAWRGVRLPSGVVGGIVLLAAFNSQRTLGAASAAWGELAERMGRRAGGGE